VTDVANWRVSLSRVDAPEVHYVRDVGMRRYYDAASLVEQAATREDPGHEWQLDEVRRVVRPLLNPLEE
jgi:hypothetical protein